MQKNKSHIAQVISELKIYKAPAGIWDKIASELNQEVGVGHLQKAIVELETLRKAPDAVWEKLEVDLDQMRAELPLQKAIADLPGHTAPYGFEDVVPGKAKQIAFDQGFKWVSGIAASLLLLVGVYFFYEDDAQVQLASYTEISGQSNEIVKAAIDQLDADDEILEVLEVHCAQIALKCESPEFKGLFDYYLELDASKEELIGVMNDNQEQVQLVDYLVRVEKEKDEVGKQLIQMIIG